MIATQGSSFPVKYLVRDSPECCCFTWEVWLHMGNHSNTLSGKAGRIQGLQRGRGLSGADETVKLPTSVVVLFFFSVRENKSTEKNLATESNSCVGSQRCQLGKFCIKILLFQRKRMKTQVKRSDNGFTYLFLVSLKMS